ncbi:family 1 glycosylhydrolase [Hymenobacter humi]
MEHNTFIFATGIENSYPVISLPDGSRLRVDEMQLTQHDQRWPEDFQLVRELGLTYLRFGPPYYATHLGPGRYDWSWADATFTRLRELGIEPIVDLCHFGVPDWLGNFQNKDWPTYFAEYAQAFARRYPHLRFYTPVNEIMIAATFSAQLGWWNECLTGDTSFVTALSNLCRANLQAMHAILSVQPRAIFIQSEATEYFHAEEPSERCLQHTAFLNEKRFLAFDLTYGHEVKASLYTYLLDNGMQRQEYEWFRQNTVKRHCVMGNDYYQSNEHLVHEDGSTSESGEIFGYYSITHQYFSRYRLPVMHTETNREDPEAVLWLRKEWANVHRLKQDGVPIVGFTWYSLLDQVDWDTCLRGNHHRVNRLGLYDLDRRVRPVGEAYKSLVSKWKPELTSECYGLHIYNF